MGTKNHLMDGKPLTILLRYRGKEGSALLFSREMHESGLMEEIRKEKGNIRYEHYRSLEDPEVLLLVDSWESQEALDLHHASPIMGRIASLREKYDLTVEAERLLPAGENPGDERFLRR